jgi:hypothetical protein
MLGSFGLPELVRLAVMLLCPLAVLTGGVVLAVWLLRRKRPEVVGEAHPTGRARP